LALTSAQEKEYLYGYVTRLAEFKVYLLPLKEQYADAKQVDAVSSRTCTSERSTQLLYRQSHHALPHQFIMLTY